MINHLLRILPEPVRWYSYLAFHRILNGRVKPRIAAKTTPDTSHYTWIFCSTIGELNACKLLLQHYAALGNVLLLTDREIYLESFKTQFPQAHVTVADMDFRNTVQLMASYPPKLAIVCEIPLLLHDAPCRLSYGVLRSLKKNQVRICLVNGWLYGYKPACKQDRIEKRLFEQDYLHCFDMLSVQTDEVKQALLAQGATADKLLVTGNMKYDNLDTNLVLTAQSQAILQVLKHNNLFVAGCVTDVWEYKLVIEAFTQARRDMPGLKLVIAPRHPEKPEQLTALEQLLQQQDLLYDYRSQITAQSLQLKDALLIDTFGELKGFYSVASACYVGINHNILEPLSLNKPVAVLDNWEKAYPSYPVFKIAEQAQMLTIVSNAAELAQFLCTGTVAHDDLCITKLKKLSGALSENIRLIGS